MPVCFERVDPHNSKITYKGEVVTNLFTYDSVTKFQGKHDLVTLFHGGVGATFGKDLSIQNLAIGMGGGIFGVGVAETAYMSVYKEMFELTGWAESFELSENPAGELTTLHSPAGWRKREIDHMVTPVEIMRESIIARIKSLLPGVRFANRRSDLSRMQFEIPVALLYCRAMKEDPTIDPKMGADFLRYVSKMTPKRGSGLDRVKALVSASVLGDSEGHGASIDTDVISSFSMLNESVFEELYGKCLFSES